MSSQSTKPQSVRPSATVHFDDRTALHLIQAFSQESELDRVLALMLSQLMALCGAHGLKYSHERLGLEMSLGRTAMHNAEYNLDLNETHLGTLTVYFPRRRNEPEIQTCEDLLCLAFTAIRNAVVLHERAAQPAPADTPAASAQLPLSKHEKSDALILLALDGYQAVRRQDGDEWAQILMSSVHAQIDEGLRQADGVYQIGDEMVAVLLPNTSLQQAHDVAGKIRVLIASLHLRGGDVEQQLTACMGISDACHAKTAEDVMANAREALAVAQGRGRNEIQVFDDVLAGKLRVG